MWKFLNESKNHVNEYEGSRGVLRRKWSRRVRKKRGECLLLIQESKWEHVDDSRAGKLWGRGNVGFHFVGSR